MTPNEELKALMKTLPLKQEQVADLLEPTSVDTVKGWCSSLGSSRFRKMPEPMLRLLKYELREQGFFGLEVSGETIRLKSTTTDRIVSTIRNEIVSDRHFLPDVKEKLCSTLNHYEIFQLAQLVAKSIADDDRLKVILLQEKK